ncbi:SWIB-domain-containing protein [Saccharata proteae CBS 121410]|uniref:SWIB-domain-containing protein n=1 Tax=Saccharata proteae CBS 121410 TaxID=1314787 RepID=A0A9P4LUJ8_9PEZI|nr:SWIB-domain-containing protein [Saccharata proteae CBS 121410]
MPLPPEQEASYTAIIDDILAKSDLTTISAKRIRKGLQAQVRYDITPQKDEIQSLIMARFDKAAERERATETSSGAVEPAPSAAAPATNGVSASRRSEDADSSSSPKKRSEPDPDDDGSELSDVASTPPKKKHKKSSSVEDDAAFAARLQAEENGRMRSTRGGGTTRKKAPVKKKDGGRKKKSRAKVNSDDDSELGSGSDKKEVKRTGGFHKPMNLSAPLSELLGETQLSRPQTVKKIWEYVKARDLQDPSDKRQIRCDEPMRAVFKQDRVHMFTMNKILNQNLYAADE